MAYTELMTCTKLLPAEALIRTQVKLLWQQWYRGVFWISVAFQIKYS